jgi:hypothetical protein
VKSSRAKSRRTAFSLISQDVQQVLFRFWDRASRAPELEHQLIFIANGGASIERGYSFPDGLPGLLYWRQAALDRDTSSIRQALKTLFGGHALGLWINTDPTDEDLRAKLLRRVHWHLRAISTDGLVEQLRDRLGALFLHKRLPALAVNDAVRGLADRVFETACESDPEQRRLTRLDLHRVVEEFVAPLAVSQMMARSPHIEKIDPVETTPHTALITELHAPPGTFTRRSKAVVGLREQTRGEPVIWIHGSHGVGKSTLARLIASQIGGRWLVLDLKPVQHDALGCLAAWQFLMRILATDPSLDGLIVDDLAKAAVPALRTRVSSLVATFSGRGARIIVTAPQIPSHATLLELGSSARALVQAPYFTEDEVIELVSTDPAPNKAMWKAWAAFIRITTSGGHPLLTAAKIASLRARLWPDSGLVEDFLRPASEAVHSTKVNARRELLAELATFDTAKSVNAAGLLRRVASVFDRVDEELVMKLAASAPPIEHASDLFAVVQGSWLETVAPSDFRISPVISDIIADVQEADILQWRCIAAEYWLSKRTLDDRTLPLCFWNAFLGKHQFVLAKLLELLQTMPRDRLAGAAALLSGITALVTDRSAYPENPGLAVQLRMFQFDVADTLGQEDLVGKIAARLLVEVEEIPHRELRALLISVSAPKVLMARSSQIDYGDLITSALKFKREMPFVTELTGRREASKSILGDLHERIDLAGFLFAGTLNQLRGPKRFLELVCALDKIAPADRNYLIDAMDTLFEGLTTFVHQGWASDQLADRDLHEALGYYNQAVPIVANWGRVDVASELSVALSVIHDEGLNDPLEAIGIMDAAFQLYGRSPSLVRQKAKVMLHHGRDEEATNLLLSVEEEVGASSPLDRALALRDGAVAAARSKRFPDAVRLLEKASYTIQTRPYYEAFHAGLVLERALTQWESGDRASGLATLADAFELIERISPEKDRQSQHAHRIARNLVGLFHHDIERFPRDARPQIAFGRASEIHSDTADLLNLDLKPLEHNWRLLALIELEAGLDVGIESKSTTRQGSTEVRTIEARIHRARYERALLSSEIDGSLGLGILAVSVTNHVMAQKSSSLRLSQIDRSELSSDRLMTLLSDQGWRDMMLGILIDVFLWNRMCNLTDVHFWKRLKEAWLNATHGFDEAEDFFRASTGIYAIGSSAALPVKTVAAIARTGVESQCDPRLRFDCDLLLLIHLAQSPARRALEGPLTSAIAAEWSRIVANQRFALSAPDRNIPDIEAALRTIPTTGIRGFAQLILAASPAVGHKFDDQWAAFLSKI